MKSNTPQELHEMFSMCAEDYNAEIARALPPQALYYGPDMDTPTVVIQLDLENRPDVWGVIPPILGDGNGSGQHIYSWNMFHTSEPTPCEVCGVTHTYTYLILMIKFLSPITVTFGVQFCLNKPSNMAAIEYLCTTGMLTIIDKTLDEALILDVDGVPMMYSINIPVDKDQLQTLVQMYENGPDLLQWNTAHDTM